VIQFARDGIDRLRRRTYRHAASTGRVITTLEGSGAELAMVVISKFAAVNVGIAFRPFEPFKFNMRARIFKSALLLLRSVEYTRRGRSRDWLK
jgi:hypothetical protein